MWDTCTTHDCRFEVPTLHSFPAHSQTCLSSVNSCGIWECCWIGLLTVCTPTHAYFPFLGPMERPLPLPPLGMVWLPIPTEMCWSLSRRPTVLCVLWSFSIEAYTSVVSWCLMSVYFTLKGMIALLATCTNEWDPLSVSISILTVFLKYLNSVSSLNWR